MGDAVKRAAETKYARAESQLAEDLGNGALLLDPDGNRVMELNESAAALWRALEEPMSAEEMARLLVEIYGDLPGSSFEADVKAFIEEALKCGAIRRA